MRGKIKDNTVAEVTVTRETLKELEQLAFQGHPFSVTNLTYREIQQLLTLWSLHKLLISYGIQPQFDIKISTEG